MSVAKGEENLPPAAAWDTICSQCGKRLAVVRSAWGSDNPPLCEVCSKRLIDEWQTRGSAFFWEQVRQECAGRPPHCTELLDDPLGVLSDRRRWATHVCYEPFLRWSTEEWVRQTTLHTDYAGAAVTNWRTRWPLAIGGRAVEQDRFFRRVDGWAELLNIVPFEGDEEALWAIHIDAGASVLDLFGLGTPYGQGDEKVYKTGELRYRMQGRGRGLLDLVAHADRWWAQFRGKKIIGRPYGRRRWASLDEFKNDVRAARDTGKETQEEVAKHLYTGDRQIRRELERYGIASWEEFLKTL